MTDAPGTLALCIPAWNAEGVLPRLLESARRQSIPFDEVLVHDDASTDGTARVAQSLGARVIRATENRGCSSGKNRLTAEARSGWIHYRDADDDLLPGFTEAARAWTGRADAPDAVLVAYEDRDPDGSVLATCRFDDEALRRDPVRETLLHQHSNCGLYRREAVLRAGGFDEDPRVLYNEDDAFHLRLALAGLRFGADPRVGAVVVRRPGSMSRERPVECLRAKFHVLEKAADAVDEGHRDAVALRLWRCAGALGSRLEWEYADRCLELARRLGFPAPMEGKAWFRWTGRIHPRLALRVRERAIRLLRPGLRSGRTP